MAVTRLPSGPPSFLSGGKTLIVCGPKRQASSPASSPETKTSAQEVHEPPMPSGGAYERQAMELAKRADEPMAQHRGTESPEKGTTMPVIKSTRGLPSFLTGGKTLIACGPKRQASSFTNLPETLGRDPMQPAIDALEADLLRESTEALARHRATALPETEQSPSPDAITPRPPEKP